MRYHGFQHSQDKDQKSTFHYGFLRLLHLTQAYWVLPKDKSVKYPIWQEKSMDRAFLQAVSKYQETFWKIDRVAELLSRSANLFEEHKDSTKIDEYSLFLKAHQDIPIFLDSILFYLRVQADCISNCIARFYGREGENIASQSFRKQKKWFQKENTFDKEYLEILETKTDWFKVLAGEGEKKGLRDIIIHYRGTYQIGWHNSQGNRIKILASIVNEKGFASEDLIQDIKNLVCDYFYYLDSTYEHFFSRFNKKFGSEYFENQQKHSVYFTYNSLPGGFWLYPEILNS